MGSSEMWSEGNDRIVQTQCGWQTPDNKRSLSNSAHEQGIVLPLLLKPGHPLHLELGIRQKDRSCDEMGQI